MCIFGKVAAGRSGGDSPDDSFQANGQLPPRTKSLDHDDPDPLQSIVLGLVFSFLILPLWNIGPTRKDNKGIDRFAWNILHSISWCAGRRIPQRLLYTNVESTDTGELSKWPTDVTSKYWRCDEKVARSKTGKVEQGSIWRDSIVCGRWRRSLQRWCGLSLMESANPHPLRLTAMMRFLKWWPSKQRFTTSQVT